MTNEEIVALLQEDAKGEHMAVVQYLQHAYRMGEGEMACEIEAIAREEMRHYDWLSEAIVERGGKPTIERAELLGVVDDIAQNMRFNVQAEQGAIVLYRQHMALIEDPDLRLLISRIISDEESHERDFLNFVQKAERMAAAGGEAAGEAASAQDTGAPIGPPPRIAAILKEGMDHEYGVILQYLYHRYLMPDCEIGNEIEMQAINEMQHLGWLSEEMESQGGEAEMEHGPLALEGSPAEMLQADIHAERAVSGAYSGQIPEIDDAGLKELLSRIRDHEIYHDKVFENLLEEIESQQGAKPSFNAGPGSGPTVGSLFGKKQ